MTNFDLHKSKLEEQLQLITTELKEIGIYDEQNDNWMAVPDEEDSAADADENESADYNEEWDERRAIMTTLVQEYRDIKRALAKIETGTYGICEISGEPIEEKRLNAKPDARTCIAHMNAESELPI